MRRNSQQSLSLKHPFLWLWLGVFSLLFVAGCGEPVKTERPPGVPAEAEWVGGADGGVFIAIRDKGGASGEPDKAGQHMTIYYDNGEIWHQTATELSPEDLKRLGGWDGTTLYFNDGSEQVLIH